MKWCAFVKEVEKQLRAAGVEEEQFDRVTFDTIHVDLVASLVSIIDVHVDFSNAPEEISISIS